MNVKPGGLMQKAMSEGAGHFGSAAEPRGPEPESEPAAGGGSTITK
jgi:hypothetical protein